MPTLTRARLLPALSLCLLTCAFVLACALAAPARAATLYVSPQGSDDNPGTSARPYATIQAAVNNAAPGGVVTLRAGTYAGGGNRDIDFGGKALTVNSDAGPARTMIDCGGTEAENHRGFYFHGKQAGARVEGVTIKNGFPNNGQTLTFPQNQGGAAFIEAGSEARFTHCTLTANGGELRIGASIYNAGRLTLMGCTFVGNQCSGLENQGKAAVSGCTFQGNSSMIGTGILTAGQITVTDCVFTGNTSDGTSGDGGGMDVTSDPFGGVAAVVTRCTFTGNRARNGGGVSGGQIRLTDCTFTRNVATALGGGLAAGSGDTATVARCTFRDNQAQAGGGVCALVHSTLTLTNCALANNAATDGDGGGVDNLGTLALRFCSFGGNSAQGTGDGGHVKAELNYGGQIPQGGALENDGAATLTDCILWGNSAPNEGEIGLSSSTSPATKVTHCDIQGGLSGPGNVKAAPRFLSPVAGNLRLQPGSPCRGAGLAGVTTDADGKHRPSPPSLGAYQ